MGVVVPWRKNAPGFPLIVAVAEEKRVIRTRAWIRWMYQPFGKPEMSRSGDPYPLLIECPGGALRSSLPSRRLLRIHTLQPPRALKKVVQFDEKESSLFFRERKTSETAGISTHGFCDRDIVSSLCAFSLDASMDERPKSSMQRHSAFVDAIEKIREELRSHVDHICPSDAWFALDKRQEQGAEAITTNTAGCRRWRKRYEQVREMPRQETQSRLGHRKARA